MGAGKPRHKVKGFQQKVHKANLEALKAGARRRFFVNSHADLFDNEVLDSWRQEVFEIIKRAGTLDFILVTKRIGNVVKMLPDDWGYGYTNTWLLATMVNQQEIVRDMPKLARIPAIVKGLSIEPIMGEIDLSAYLHLLDWVIIGGQSPQIGGEAPIKAEHHWVRKLIDQCLAAGIAVYFKQWGMGDGGVRGGHLIDSREIRQYPLDGVRRCVGCGCHDYSCVHGFSRSLSVEKSSMCSNCA